MRAIDGAISEGAEVRTFRTKENSELKYAAALYVNGNWHSTHYAQTATAALECLERYLGSLAIMGAKRRRWGR